MADVFSPVRQALTWRDLWIALAEIELELGVDVPGEAIASMRAARDDLDLVRVAELEADLRHDVMAHVHHFGEVAPEARPYLHLGATSCFVTDNAGLIQMRDGLLLVRTRLRSAIGQLADFAERWKGLPTLGYTHWQPAQPTTVGKRAALWLQDLLLDLEQVDAALAELRFRGARGTTGSEDSFLGLLGDGTRVDALNERLCKRFGFSGTYDVVGQTYPRKVDHRVLSVLAGIGASTSRFGQDVRLLQSFGEIEEPFGQHQIGSSAMPYKRNPMRAERICSLARHLCTLETGAAWTAAVQGLERTLDDSAIRRIAIPEAFLCADAILQIVSNVAAGLVVHEPVIAARLERHLPFLVVERILIAGVEKGGDRQDLHERLRGHAMKARTRLDEGAPDNDFFARVAADDAIDLSLEEIRALADPASLTGRSAEQVERLLRDRVIQVTGGTGHAGDDDPPELRV